MIFYNNPDFYPTPAAVIDKMLTDDSPAGLVVLEPSAGSGNIVRKLNEAGAAEVLACETDENVWARFNQEVAKTRGWKIGSTTKTAHGHKQNRHK